MRVTAPETGAQELFYKAPDSASEQARPARFNTGDGISQQILSAKRRRRFKRASEGVDIFLDTLRYPHAQAALARRLWHRSDGAGHVATTAKKTAAMIRKSKSTADELLRSVVRRSERTGVPVMEMISPGYVAESGDVVDSEYAFPALETVADAILETKPKTEEQLRALVFEVLDEHWPDWRERVEPPPAAPKMTTASGSVVKTYHTHGRNLLATSAKIAGDTNATAILGSTVEIRAELMRELLKDPVMRELARLELESHYCAEPSPEAESEEEVTDTPYPEFPGTPPSEIPGHILTSSRDSGGGVSVSLPVALDAVDRFADAGVTGFKWVLVDEPAKVAGERYIRGSSGKGRVLSADEMRSALHELTRTTASKPWSLFLRPVGPVAQLDDAPDGVDLPGVFAEIRTSEKSRQLWIRLADVDERQARKIGRRIAEKIGADTSATGSVRWPGSVNNKPDRDAFIVSVTYFDSEPVTVIDLVSAGVYEPEEPPPSPPPGLSLSDDSRRGHAPAERRGWPSWDRCLSDKAGDSFKADGAWVTLALLRRHDPDDVASRLLTVRAKTDSKGTLAYAVSVVVSAIDNLHANGQW